MKIVNRHTHTHTHTHTEKRRKHYTPTWHTSYAGGIMNLHTYVWDRPYIPFTTMLCEGIITLFDQIPVLGTKSPNANRAGPVQMLQNAASDQGLHCLFTGISMQITPKMKILTSETLKTANDKDGH